MSIKTTIIMLRQKTNITLSRLKSKSVIDNLFEKGDVVCSQLLLLRYLEVENQGVLFAGVSVSKRNFSKAVDRNRIKRQLREGLKKTQSLNLFPGNCMLVFTGRKQVKTHIIIREIAFLLKQK